MKSALLRGANFYLSLILLFLLSLLILELWVARPQIFSYLLAVLLIFILEKFRQTKKSKWLYFAPPLMFFWANLHSSVILGLGILLVYLASPLLIRITENKKLRFLVDAGNFTKKEISQLAIVFLLSLVLSFVNPNSYHVHTYFLDISPAVKALGIMEWKSLIHYFYIMQAKVFLALMVLTLIFIFWRWLKKSRLDVFDCFLMLLAIILPLISIRHVIYFPLLAFPILAGELSQQVSFEEKLKEPRKKRLLAQLLAIFLLLMIFSRFLNFPSQAVNEKIIPVKAADFIENNQLKEPMFNSMETGGYFIWRFWPERRVFFDGRNDVFLGKPMEDYIKIILTRGNWRELVENYGFNYFLILYRDTFFNLAFNLTQKLKEEFDYQLVYWDDSYIILVKNSAENKSLIEKFGYRVISPFLAPEQIPVEQFSEAAKELQRALEASPNSDLILIYSQIFLERLRNN